MDLPLHPFLVHFPIALSFFLLVLYPVLALWIGRDTERQKAWVLAASLAMLLILISYATLFTGEMDEELVEKVVPEEVLEAHEEAAQLFFYFSWIPFLIALAGIRPWKGRTIARWATVLSHCLLVVLLLDASHKGGELVYKYGAARAHYEGDSRPTGGELETDSMQSHEDDEHHRVLDHQ